VIGIEEGGHEMSKRTLKKGHRYLVSVRKTPAKQQGLEHAELLKDIDLALTRGLKREAVDLFLDAGAGRIEFFEKEGKSLHAFLANRGDLVLLVAGCCRWMRDTKDPARDDEVAIKIREHQGAPIIGTMLWLVIPIVAIERERDLLAFLMSL